MLLWVLCLQLWWLLLPSSTLGYPPLERALERRTLSTNPEPRDGPLISGPDDRNAADIVGRRDVVPPNGDDKLMLLDLQSPSVNYTSTPVLWQSNAPGPLNATHGEYGAYRGRGERIEFDFEYPPFTQKKIIIIRGDMDIDTTQTEVYLEVMGYPIGDFIGNLDDGMRIDVNLVLAKGFVALNEVQGNPDDSVYLTVDLHLPFRRHLTEKWLLFKLKHHDITRAQEPSPLAATKVPSAAQAANMAATA